MDLKIKCRQNEDRTETYVPDSDLVVPVSLAYRAMLLHAKKLKSLRVEHAKVEFNDIRIDYNNPEKSIIVSGFCMTIVVKPSYTIFIELVRRKEDEYFIKGQFQFNSCLRRETNKYIFNCFNLETQQAKWGKICSEIYNSFRRIIEQILNEKKLQIKSDLQI